MNKLLVLFVASYFIVIEFLYAAPVDVPTVIQGLEGNIFKDKKLGIALSIAGETDFLSSRKLDEADWWGGGTSKVKGQFYTSKMILTVINKIDIYGIFGKAENLESRDAQGGSTKPKDKLTWGAGLSMPIYEWKNYGIKFFADTKYRAVNNIDYNSNIQQPPSLTGDILPKFLVDWQEWQVAFGAAKKFKYFMPYGGLKYSDFKELSGDRANYADTNVGIFVGCAITPIKEFSVDLQVRVVDETAVAIKATYKF